MVQKNHLLYSKWIGSDECGKGDYFGPLVVSAVLVKKSQEKILSQIGVKDSKEVSDSSIFRIAKEIKKNLVYTVSILMPEMYNELYIKFKNLNSLLAFYHAKVIKDIIKVEDCRDIVVDKFADEKLLNSELNDKNLNIYQMFGAEEDIGVASASILARSEFLLALDGMSKKYKIKFLKGASDEVVDVGKKFVEKYGFKELNNVAKLHFKITKKIALASSKLF